MKVTINDTTFFVDFKKIAGEHHDGSLKLNTLCTITCAGHPERTYSGVARLSYRDQYDRIKGKKVALKKALFMAAPHFDKVDRAVIWAAFFTEFDKKHTQVQDNNPPSE